MHRELPGVPTTGTSAANSWGNRVHGMPVGHYNTTAMRALLCLGMVVLVPCLGPHQRLSAGVLLSAAGRPRTGLGSGLRLDQYLHLAVRGPAPASAADQFEFLHHVHHQHQLDIDVHVNHHQYNDIEHDLHHHKLDDVQYNIVHHVEHDFNHNVIDDEHHHDKSAHNQFEHDLHHHDKLKFDEFQHQHDHNFGLLLLPVSLAVGRRVWLDALLRLHL
jgi:hypothetical protein